MKIGELSEKVSLSTYTIRYYEKMGFLKQPTKDQSGHRYYSDEDVEQVNWITFLKKSGMTLENIKVYSRALQNGEIDQQSELLQKHLAMLEAQKRDTQQYIEVTSDKLQILKTA